MRDVNETIAEAMDVVRCKLVYETGAIVSGKGKQIDPAVLKKEETKKFNISRADRFANRTRYFTDSGIIGSREFVRENFQRFKGLVQPKKDKLPKRVSGLEGIYSLKRLA